MDEDPLPLSKTFIILSKEKTCIFIPESQNYIMELPFAVYILKCNDGKYYTGFSENISNRFKSHAKGEVHFTKSRLPVKLVHLSLFSNKQKAYDFERYLKSGSGIAFRNKRLIE